MEDETEIEYPEDSEDEVEIDEQDPRVTEEEAQYQNDL